MKAFRSSFFLPPPLFSSKRGSDSFSGRRKLFWGNDDHLKSRAALSFQFYLDITSELQGHFPWWDFPESYIAEVFPLRQSLFYLVSIKKYCQKCNEVMMRICFDSFARHNFARVEKAVCWHLLKNAWSSGNRIITMALCSPNTQRAQWLSLLFTKVQTWTMFTFWPLMTR